MWTIPTTVRQLAPLLRLALVLAAVPYVVNQVRKPTNWVGRFFLWIMNFSHSNLTDRGLEHVEIDKDFAILDVGCGGGRTIQKLAAVARQGRIYGVDYAKGA
jgi:ubiquinone/menaquinone biosynthesis C-methylase UbiE